MRLENMSLKTKMAVVVSLLFVAFTTSLIWFVVSYYGRVYKATISKQQYMLVSAIADSIDDKLNILLNAMASEADNFPHDGVFDGKKAQQYLDARLTLLSVFDNGLFLISSDGRLIAESPFLPNRRGRDISFRDFYKKTLATGQRQISSPYLSTHSPGQPAIMLTAPIFDHSGRQIAMLAGSIDLMGKNILYGITPLKIGNSGYIFISDSKRTVILHPDKRRIMKNSSPEGVNVMFDRAIAGFDGSGETTNTNGTGQIVSAKHLRTTDWIVAAAYPLAEAYAPLEKIEIYFVSAITTGMGIMLILVWLLMRWMTQPLLRFAHHVESLTENPGTTKMFDLECSDEIGTLTRAFNGMVLELARREDSLRESEQRYKSLFEHTPAVMLLINSETGDIADANSAACSFYGYSIEALKTRNVTDINILASAEVHENLQRAVHGQKHHFLFRHALGDGSERDVEVYCGPVQIKGKSMLFSIVHDVTARKQAEEAFLESHKLLETTLASLNEAVFIVESSTSLIMDCNPMALQMFGYSRHDMLGRSTTFLHVTEANAEWFRSELRKGYESVGYFETLYRMKRADGTIFPSEHFVTPIRDADGNVRNHICVVRDITERKRVEDEYRRLNELLEQRVNERTAELLASNRELLASNQELESFCYSVSHDLRSPLRGINGFCSILKEDYAEKLDKDGGEYLDRISLAAVRMGHLIDDLLNLSRVTRSEIVSDMVDLSQMAFLIIQEFQQLDPERVVEFKAVNGVLAKADRHLIRVVFENLLGNAWKFTNKRQCSKIEFGVGESNGEAFYFVSDNGIGFSMEYAHKLFKPFQRLHDVTEFVGTGIGLASVQRIINRHGGRIWVESQPDKGTTFYFTLVD